MTSRPNVRPPSFLPQAPSSASAASLRSSGRVPRPPRYYQPTPTSRPPSRLASSPSLGTTTASPSFAPPETDDAPRAWTTSTAAPAPPPYGGEDETSQVPGRPLRTCPALRPRRTPGPRPLQGRECGLPLDSTSAPLRTLSRLYHAACTLSVYASQPGSPPDLRNTRFRMAASLVRSGLSPAGSRRRFPSCLSVYMASPFTALPGARIHDFRQPASR